ncbi:MAG TPA: hypothetical protein VJV79_40565 [Polyangiaceae bacterium]|nr:hypothetical protein [Polyangiaceae bacterium]
MRDSLAIALGMMIGGVLTTPTRAHAREPLPVYPVVADEEPSVAANDEAPRPRFDDHPLAIEVRTGAAAATGLLGAVLQYSVHDRLLVNAGVGTNLLGISSSLGVGVRPLVVASGNRKQLHAMILETSLSRSAYVGELGGAFFCETGCVRPRYVAWAQAEVGWQARFGRWQIQTSLGAATLLGKPQFSCTPSQADPDDCGTAVTRVLMTQTIGFGYAF